VRNRSACVCSRRAFTRNDECALVGAALSTPGHCASVSIARPTCEAVFIDLDIDLRIKYSLEETSPGSGDVDARQLAELVANLGQQLVIGLARLRRRDHAVDRLDDDE
jgi:hypothetical protein